MDNNSNHIFNVIVGYCLLSCLLFRITDGEVCFRRYLVLESGVCKGMSRVLATTVDECCSHRGAKGYATSKQLLPGSHNKYHCLPCTSFLYGSNSIRNSSAQVFHTGPLTELHKPAQWYSWRPWGQCSVTCGGGVRMRIRTCDQSLTDGSPACEGTSSESQPCAQAPCPVDGQWSDWSDYGACSVSCGTGYKIRYRKCDNPYPAYGGNDCEGYNWEKDMCDVQCPIAGGWSDWTDWSQCSTSCGSGWQSRHRSCTNPAPSMGGKPCYGPQSESQACRSTDPQCYVSGGWCNWSEWGECQVSMRRSMLYGFGSYAGRTGSSKRVTPMEKSRFRHCQCPPPSDPSLACKGERIQKIACSRDEAEFIENLEEGSALGGSGCGPDGSNVDCDQEEEDNERIRHMKNLSTPKSSTEREMQKSRLRVINNNKILQPKKQLSILSDVTTDSSHYFDNNDFVKDVNSLNDILVEEDVEEITEKESKDSKPDRKGIKRKHAKILNKFNNDDSDYNDDIYDESSGTLNMINH